MFMLLWGSGWKETVHGIVVVFDTFKDQVSRLEDRVSSFSDRGSRIKF